MQKKTFMSVVYSTNPDFDYQVVHHNTGLETPPPGKQNLLVGIDRKQRAGKQVTVVERFIGKNADLELLGKMLKTKCGVGGAVKEGVILIQGDCRERVISILQNAGYKAKRSN